MPRNQRNDGPYRARRLPKSRALAIAASLLAVILRLFGIALCALVVLLCFSGMAARLSLVGLVVDLSRMLPDVIAGYGVITTPFGGVFRLDFALMAVAFFLLDCLLCRLSRALRP